MHTAKIIRHRHKVYHYLNDDLKSAEEETHFKIVFSHPEETERFKEWCTQYGGEYDYDKEKHRQNGKLPRVAGYEEEICWCDIMQYYLLHVAGYQYHSALSPYKGEVYIKENV